MANSSDDGGNESNPHKMPPIRVVDRRGWEPEDGVLRVKDQPDLKKVAVYILYAAFPDFPPMNEQGLLDTKRRADEPMINHPSPLERAINSPDDHQPYEGEFEMMRLPAPVYTVKCTLCQVSGVQAGVIPCSAHEVLLRLPTVQIMKVWAMDDEDFRAARTMQVSYEKNYPLTGS